MTDQDNLAYPCGAIGEDADEDTRLLVESDQDRTVWVRHLPSKKPRPLGEWGRVSLVVSGREAFDESNNPFLLHFHMVSFLRRFKEEKDPYYAVEIFRMCHVAGVYPPVEVLEWLDKAIQAFAESEGSADLGQLLGLQGGGPRARKGQNAYASRVTKDRRRHNAALVHYLVCLFPGISIGNAATMVSARESERDDSTPEQSWIDEDYRKKWKKEFDWNPIEGWSGEEVRRFRREMLATFPEWSIPRNIKKKYMG